jgi:hypothetical protein
VKEIRIEAEAPNIVYFKTNFSDDFEEVVLYSNVVSAPIKRRKVKLFEFDQNLEPAYAGKLSIGKAKYLDLLSLCKAGIIPANFHAFYKSLCASDTDPEDNEEDFCLNVSFADDD